VNNRNIIKLLYQSSPEYLANQLKYFYRDYSNRNKPGIAKRLTNTHINKRNKLIRILIDKVLSGEDIYKTLKSFNAREYDERVLEYTYLTHWLLKQKKSDLLDIGAVTNNDIISDVLQNYCNAIWICNIAIEQTIYIKNPVYYHISSLEDSFSNNSKFPLITCLSTIEHIGYDNSQYKTDVTPIYNTPAIEPLIKSLTKIANLAENHGKILISIPYGYREVLSHPSTGKISSQVFDYESLKEGIKALNEQNIKTNLEVLEAKEFG